MLGSSRLVILLITAVYMFPLCISGSLKVSKPARSVLVPIGKGIYVGPGMTRVSIVWAFAALRLWYAYLLSSVAITVVESLQFNKC